MRRLSPSAFWLVAPAALALWFIAALPSRWYGIDTGAIGAMLLIAAAVVGLWLASRIPGDAEEKASPGEQKRWVALAFIVLIGAAMLLGADVFARASSVADLGDVGRPIGIFLVGWVIFSALMRQRLGARVQEDERDRAVEAVADAWSHGALAVTVVGIAVMFGLSPAGRLQWATPIVTAHLLMFALLWSSFVGSVVAIVLYRRQRR